MQVEQYALRLEQNEDNWYEEQGHVELASVYQYAAQFEVASSGCLADKCVQHLVEALYECHTDNVYRHGAHANRSRHGRIVQLRNEMQIYKLKELPYEVVEHSGHSQLQDLGVPVSVMYNFGRAFWSGLVTPFIIFIIQLWLTQW